MGSIRFIYDPNEETNRQFGRKWKEVQFYDEDGILVLASILLDNKGLAFELEIWKTDFNPCYIFLKKKTSQSLNHKINTIKIEYSKIEILPVKHPNSFKPFLFTKYFKNRLFKKLFIHSNQNFHRSIVSSSAIWRVRKRTEVSIPNFSKLCLRMFLSPIFRKKTAP